MDGPEQRTGATTSPTTPAMRPTPTTRAPLPAMQSTSPSQSFTGPVMQVGFWKSFFCSRTDFGVIHVTDTVIVCDTLSCLWDLTAKFFRSQMVLEDWATIWLLCYVARNQATEAVSKQIQVEGNESLNDEALRWNSLCTDDSTRGCYF